MWLTSLPSPLESHTDLIASHAPGLQVLNIYRAVKSNNFPPKKSTILQRDLGVHLPFFETAILLRNADHQIQFSWKLSLHPNIQVNPNTSPTKTIDAVFLRTILAPRKKTTHTHTYWNLPLFQATLLLLASSFKRCQVDPRFKHRRFRSLWDVNHPSIGNLRQAGFIHNLPSLKLTVRPWKSHVSWKIPFKWWIFHGYVSLQET